MVWSDKVPMGTNMNAFVGQQSRPLKALRAFAQGLAGAKEVGSLENLKFRYALAEELDVFTEDDYAAE